MPKNRNTKTPKNGTVIYRKYTDPVAPPEDALLLTQREAAYILRISYRTLYVWCRRKRNPPPVTWINNHSPRFPRGALLEWATRQGKPACTA